jgi:hypothetical protein
MPTKLFISYSHEDKSVAKQVAEALSQRGYEVFWDAKIPTGMTFDTYIYRELEDSDAVIVLWSKPPSMTIMGTSILRNAT